MNGTTTIDLAILIAEACDSDDPALTRKAVQAQRAAERLADALDEYRNREVKEQARKRLAELEAERALLVKIAGPKRGRPKKQTPIDHGRVGAANQHRARGEEPCDFCRLAELQHMANLRARKAAGNLAAVPA